MAFRCCLGGDWPYAGNGGLIQKGWQVVGRMAPYSLYREDFATFGQDDVYDQADAEGFINLFGLPLKVQALVDKQNGMLPGLVAPDYSDFKRD